MHVNGKRQKIMREMFPKREDEWQMHENMIMWELFSMEEMKTVCKSMKGGTRRGWDYHGSGKTGILGHPKEGTLGNEFLAKRKPLS